VSLSDDTILRTVLIDISFGSFLFLSILTQPLTETPYFSIAFACFYTGHVDVFSMTHEFKIGFSGHEKTNLRR